MLRSLTPLSLDQRTRLGLRASSGHMYAQDKIWSRYSNDKIDIARMLARVLRTLHKALPLDQPITALSIGSSNGPQFRILESACRGGLYLLDIEDAALRVVEERSERQQTPHVKTIRGDYRDVLRNTQSVRQFRERELDGQHMTLITLHHSLYYSSQTIWHPLFMDLYQELLSPIAADGPSAAIHAVLMASQSSDPTSTTWLYNHFAEKFFNSRNDQDLLACAVELQADTRFADARILTESNQVQFFTDDF